MNPEKKVIRSYYPSGALWFETEVNRQGQRDGVSLEYHENGKPKSQSSWKNMVFDGVFKQWRDDGALLGEFVITAGNGVFKHWHDNGQLGLETEYRKGAKHGVSRVYDPLNGKCMLTQYFLSGRKVPKKKYIEVSEKTDQAAD